MNRFEEKSVIVTGAASGFGTAIARKFANEGAQIICADLNMAGASELASELANAVPFEIDVANEQQNKDMIECAVDHFGKIDVLCCNAGIPHKGNYMIRMPVEDFDKMWAVNVRSIFLAARAAVPHMPPGSSIISTASIGGKRPRPGLVPYNASKAAVITLTQGMAVEMAPNIRVNCVCPVSSPTNFDFQTMGTQNLSEEMEKKVLETIPMGRRATPEDVADGYAFLASDEAKFITGTSLDIDGGRAI